MPYEDSMFHVLNDHESILGSKLNLRPQGSYEESLEAIDSLLEEEYETVVEAAVEMHPRISHEVFRYAGMESENTTTLEEVMIKDVKDIVEKNSEKEFGWVDEKLFNLGYSRFPKSPGLSELYRTPYANHISDNLDFSQHLFTTPYGRGRRKRESDLHYFWANNFLIEDIGHQEIRIE